jgi:hypothetical protein
VTSLAKAPAPPRRAPGGASALRAYAFGLEFSSTPATPTVSVPPRGGVRRLAWSIVERREFDAPLAGGRQLLDRRHPSGRPLLMIEQSAEGYLIVAPGYGRHLVGADGGSLRSYLPNVPAWRWQRLLFAQALPLSATLQGLHMAHASAVVLDGHAIGFVASSGAGKTSVCAHLVAGGASFMTDDVLALEADASGNTLAHPGAAIVAIHRHELAGMSLAGRRRLGPVIGRSDKLLVRLEPVDRPLPLERLYFLRRSAGCDAVAIAESRPPDPRLLLATGFLWYLRDPHYELARLEAAAALARATRIFTVDVPAAVTAAELAERVADHAGRR